ncbi:MAG: SDR family NAD(P)-dependent oxidoreductase [Xanthomonadales bacterium]|nr:SDR family NAD(P)-dependent oxidoreductase [Xanthomonadales bacterium]
MQFEGFAVVTGANRGLGYAVSEALARKGWRVLMTGRDRQKICDAAEALQGEGLNVAWMTLDVTDPEHIELLHDRLAHHEDLVDALVNNAGVWLETGTEADPAGVSALGVAMHKVERTMDINALGALRVAQVVIPWMRNGGCIVNVSSGMGQFAEMGANYPGYRMSKVALNALTCILAAELEDRNIKVNSVSPGWVRTDMGGPKAERSIEQGIEGILWAAMLPEDGPSGGFFRDGEPLDW